MHGLTLITLLDEICLSSELEPRAAPPLAGSLRNASPLKSAALRYASYFVGCWSELVFKGMKIRDRLEIRGTMTVAIMIANQKSYDWAGLRKDNHLRGKYESDWFHKYRLSTYA